MLYFHTLKLLDASYVQMLPRNLLEGNQLGNISYFTYSKKMTIWYDIKSIEFALFMCVILWNIMHIDSILAISDQ